MKQSRLKRKHKFSLAYSILAIMIFLFFVGCSENGGGDAGDSSEAAQPEKKGTDSMKNNDENDASVAENIQLTENGVECTCKNGGKETVLFSDLLKVAIVTTSSGPVEDDVFWLLETQSLSVLIPHSIDDDDKLLVRLQKLPDFDNMALIQAMSCTDDKKFPCWEKPK